MDFIEGNDQFSENLMLADDHGNRIYYGEYEKIYEERSKFLEEGRLAFLYCRNAIGAVLYYRSCLTNFKSNSYSRYVSCLICCNNL